MKIAGCEIIVFGGSEYVDPNKYARLINNAGQKEGSVLSTQPFTRFLFNPNEFNFDNPYPAVERTSKPNSLSEKHLGITPYLNNQLESIQFKIPDGNVIIFANRNELRLCYYDFNTVKERWSSFIKGFPNSGQKLHGVPFPFFIPEYLIYFHEDCQRLGGKHFQIAKEIDSYANRYGIIISHKKVRQNKAQWKQEQKHLSY